jgi:hypothetical protein
VPLARWLSGAPTRVRTRQRWTTVSGQDLDCVLSVAMLIMLFSLAGALLSSLRLLRPTRNPST